MERTWLRSRESLALTKSNELLMSRSIQITFDQKQEMQEIHRVQNFAEELSRNLEAKDGWGKLPMTDADRATTHILIRNVHAKKLTRVLAFVETLLKKHHFERVNVSDIHQPE